MADRLVELLNRDQADGDHAHMFQNTFVLSALECLAAPSHAQTLAEVLNPDDQETFISIVATLSRIAPELSAETVAPMVDNEVTLTLALRRYERHGRDAEEPLLALHDATYWKHEPAIQGSVIGGRK